MSNKTIKQNSDFWFWTTIDLPKFEVGLFDYVKTLSIFFSDGFYWILRENLPTVISFWFGKQSGLPEWYLLATFIYLWPWHLWKITEISFLTETWTLQILSSFSMKWQRNMMEKLFCLLQGTWYINSKPWFLINSSIITK